MHLTQGHTIHNSTENKCAMKWNLLEKQPLKLQFTQIYSSNTVTSGDIFSLWEVGVDNAKAARWSMGHWSAMILIRIPGLLCKGCVFMHLLAPVSFCVYATRTKPHKLLHNDFFYSNILHLGWTRGNIFFVKLYMTCLWNSSSNCYISWTVCNLACA